MNFVKVKDGIEYMIAVVYAINGKKVIIKQECYESTKIK